MTSSCDGMTWTMNSVIVPVLLCAFLLSDNRIFGEHNVFKLQDACSKRHKLLLISLDGFRFDYLRRGLTPNLARMADEGVSGKMLAQFPSLTFPNHFSMVTGRLPTEHGIVLNAFYDPSMNKYFHYADPSVMTEPRWWQAEPIWKTVQGFGLTSGVVFWPGSEASGIEPNEFVVYDGNLDIRKRLELVETWLPRHDLVATYISSLDKIGHEHGPDSVEMNKGLSEVDALVGELLDRIPLDTNVIVVSDHGMAQVKHRVLIDDVLPNWKKQLKWVDFGPVASLIPQVGLTVRVYEELKSRLQAMQAPIQVYKPEEIPTAFRFRGSKRIAPITLICQHGWMFDKHRSHRVPLGAHGYDPEHPSMHSMLIARGPSFKQHPGSHSNPERAFAPVSNLDLYPLMCHLLQIECLKGHHGSEALSQHVLVRQCSRSRAPSLFPSSYD